MESPPHRRARRTATRRSSRTSWSRSTADCGSLPYVIAAPGNGLRAGKAGPHWPGRHGYVRPVPSRRRRHPPSADVRGQLRGRDRPGRRGCVVSKARCSTSSMTNRSGAGQFLRAYKRERGWFPSVRVPYPLAYLLSCLWERYSVTSEGQLPPVFNRSRCSAEWKGNVYDNRKLKAGVDAACGPGRRDAASTCSTRETRRRPASAQGRPDRLREDRGPARGADPRVPGATLVAACDSEPLMSQQLAERFGVERRTRPSSASWRRPGRTSFTSRLLRRATSPLRRSAWSPAATSTSRSPSRRLPRKRWLCWTLAGEGPQRDRRPQRPVQPPRCSRCAHWSRTDSSAGRRFTLRARSPTTWATRPT